MNSNLQLRKDKMGKTYILSHKRCGFTEYIWLTPEELEQLKKML